MQQPFRTILQVHEELNPLHGARFVFEGTSVTEECTTVASTPLGCNSRLAYWTCSLLFLCCLRHLWLSQNRVCVAIYGWKFEIDAELSTRGKCLENQLGAIALYSAHLSKKMTVLVADGFCALWTLAPFRDFAQDWISVYLVNVLCLLIFARFWKWTMRNEWKNWFLIEIATLQWAARHNRTVRDWIRFPPSYEK